VDGDIGGDCRAACRQGLEHQCRIQPFQPAATHVLTNINARHAERRDFAYDIDGKLLVCVPFQRMRCDTVRRKGARHVANMFLFRGQAELRRQAKYR
jgi:hypothetical protein